VSGALTLQRLAASLLTILGAIAFVVASLGLYGTLAQTVEQRRPEIGIRMALGARDVDVLWQFTLRGLALASVGVTIGASIYPVVGRLLKNQVYGVGSIDTASLAVTAAIFAIVSGAASFATALRAARVDPTRSIRAE
jgi:ABC-type antimicrobial peptide transport system permease subunit